MVSFSNPVRQSLYEYTDCLDGGKPKAVAAAAMLKRIFPGCHAAGVKMNIPMPGHFEESDDIRDAAMKLEQLIKKHDAIFMLLDTREARWAPTMMCAAHNKIGITAALGFDSFLVMRHGCSPSIPHNGSEIRLGCYFCNDIVAPLNTTKDRSMDEQCTVARPGLSAICGSLAAELLATILQHPRKNMALPMSHQSDNHNSSSEAPLGDVPHMIRGSLQGFSQQCFTAHAFPLCPACGPTIVSDYLSRESQTIIDAVKSPTFLEETSGLRNLHETCEEHQEGSCDAAGEEEGWTQL